ncbi:reverse transcriptase domain-containing protein [Tanacetum coccineum]
MFKQLRLEIGLKDALIEMPKFNKWLSSLLRNKEKLEEIAITTVNAECSAIIMNKVPEKLEDPVKFLIPCALQELDRTSALANSGASINLLPYSIYKKLGLGALTPTRMTLELANQIILRIVEIKASSYFTLTSPEESAFEADSIPPGIDLTLHPTLEVSSSQSLLPYSYRREDIKEKEDELVQVMFPITYIVMPIRITFDNPIDFNDHFSKPKDFKKDLTVTLDSSESSILPPLLLDSDSPFTAELLASVTLNSLENEDKVFKPSILVYHVIHDKNLVTLEEN